MAMNEREGGRVKWYNAAKGFGFCEPDDPNMADIFIHISQVPDGVELQTGDRIGFGIEVNKNHPEKLRAVGVKLLLPS